MAQGQPRSGAQLRFGTMARSAVHLCIDMQRLFASEGPWPTPWMDRVLPVVETLVAHRPERTIFTRFIPPRSPAEVGGAWRRLYAHHVGVTRDALDPGLLDLVPPLQRFVPPARIIDKCTYSAFSGTGLHQELQQAAIDTLIVTGAETDVCVLATVFAAIEFGYRVVVVSDGVCSSSDAGHDALMQMYRERLQWQTEMAPSEAVIAAWTG